MSRYLTTTKHHLPEEPLYVVILAASLGYREKGKGPKVLHIHEGMSILEYQAKTIHNIFPKAIISVTAGFQAEKIIRFKPDYVTVIENQLWETHGNIEDIRLYLNSVNARRVLFVDGAILFTSSIFDITTRSSIYCVEDSELKEVGVYIEDGRVINFSYGLNLKWPGLLYLEDRDLIEFKKICTKENSKLCLFEALNMLVDKKINLQAFLLNKKEMVRI